VIILTAALALLAIIYWVFGRQLIRDAYDASVSGKPTISFIDHRQATLEHYFERGDKIFWEFLFFGVPLTLLFWFGLWKLVRKLLGLTTADDAIDDLTPTRLIRFDWLLAIALYTVLTIVYFWPSLSTMSTALIGPPEDNMGGLWCLWWGCGKALTGTWSLTFTNYLYYPEGTSLYYFAWSFYNLLVAFLMRLSFGAVTVYNLVILHGYPIAGLGAFLLARYLTKDSLVALIAGFVFAFNPAHFIRSQHHININSIQFIPFFVLYYIRTVREAGAKNLALAALFFLLNTLCDWTYMIFACYFMLFSYLYLVLKRHQLLLRDVLAKTALIVAVTVVLLSPWLWGMVREGLTNPEVDVGGRNTFVTDLLGLVVPGQQHWLGSTNAVAVVNNTYTGYPWETTSYLGLAGLLVVLLAWRRIVIQASRQLLGGVAFLVMALGPQLHLLGKSLPVGLPYTLIAFVPFLSNVRCPSRFIVYVYLFWGIVVAFAVRSLVTSCRYRRTRALLTILLPLLLVVDFFSICNAKTEVSLPPCYQVIMRDSERFGILDLPNEYEQVCRYMMYQTFHNIPIVEGATTRKIGKSLIDRLDFQNLASQREQLIEGRVKYIVIHKGEVSTTVFDPEPYRQAYPSTYEDAQNLVLKVY
jgi:hypothetical protein